MKEIKLVLIWKDWHGSRLNQFVYGANISSVRRQAIEILDTRTSDGAGALVTPGNMELYGQIFTEHDKWYFKTSGGRPFRIGTSGRRVKA
jgi:hypothetical protein